jgi:hypothetical protein
MAALARLGLHGSWGWFQARRGRGRRVWLTTQLLWRLQQSSPFHSSTTSNLVVPVIPEAALALIQLILREAYKSAIVANPNLIQGTLALFETGEQQLLWRLQQSSPFHSSTTSNLVVPVIPEAALETGV